MSCYDCQRDPGLQQAWGCESPTQAAVWVDDENEDEYYICPARLIPESVIEWYAEYTYYKEFSGTAPGYHEQGEKWLEAASVYGKYYIDALKTKQDQQSKQSDRIMTNEQRS